MKPGSRVRVTEPLVSALDRHGGWHDLGAGATGVVTATHKDRTYRVLIAGREFDLPASVLEPVTPPPPDPGPYPSRPAGLYEEIGGEG